MNDFCIKLETLGHRRDGAIVSIGVVQFEILTGKMGQTFYREISIDSAVKAGRVTERMLNLYMQQEGKAKRIFAIGDKKTPLPTALDELRTFIREASLKAGGELAKVWADGTTGDIAALEYAYDHGAVGLTEPWHLSNVRDAVTIVSAAGWDFNNWPFPREGKHHTALEDAAYTAQVISASWLKIKRAIGEVKDVPKDKKPTAAPTPKPAAPPPPPPAVDEDDDL